MKYHYGLKEMKTVSKTKKLSNDYKVKISITGCDILLVFKKRYLWFLWKKVLSFWMEVRKHDKMYGANPDNPMNVMAYQGFYIERWAPGTLDLNRRIQDVYISILKENERLETARIAAINTANNLINTL